MLTALDSWHKKVLQEEALTQNITGKADPQVPWEIHGDRGIPPKAGNKPNFLNFGSSIVKILPLQTTSLQCKGGRLQHRSVYVQYGKNRKKGGMVFLIKYFSFCQLPLCSLPHSNICKVRENSSKL